MGVFDIPYSLQLSSQFNKVDHVCGHPMDFRWTELLKHFNYKIKLDIYGTAFKRQFQIYQDLFH